MCLNIYDIFFSFSSVVLLCLRGRVKKNFVFCISCWKNSVVANHIAQLFDWLTDWLSDRLTDWLSMMVLTVWNWLDCLKLTWQSATFLPVFAAKPFSGAAKSPISGRLFISMRKCCLYLKELGSFLYGSSYNGQYHEEISPSDYWPARMSRDFSGFW